MSDHRLSRSASANVVQPSKGVSTKRLNSAVGRCHTPPPSVLRTSLQTPPPTRASTLRAQARQVAIQRSQSARTVIEKPHKTKQLGPDLSIDNEDFTSNSNSILSRGGTFTRSITKSEQNHGRPRTPNLSSNLTSRTGIPGRSDKLCHNRNISEVTTLILKPGGIVDESHQEAHSASYQSRPTSGVVHTSSIGGKFLRAHSMEVSNKSSSIGASTFHSSLPRQKVTPMITSSQCNEVQKSNDSLIESCSRQFKYGQQFHGHKSKVPLKESTQVTFLTEILKCHDGNNSLNNDSSCGESSTSGNTGGDLPIGLGCRSNTFCKDDLPKTGENLVEN